MKSHLEEKREELVGRREQLLGEFSETARAADDAQLGKVFLHIRLQRSHQESSVESHCGAQTGIPTIGTWLIKGLI